MIELQPTGKDASVLNLAQLLMNVFPKETGFYRAENTLLHVRYSNLHLLRNDTTKLPANVIGSEP